MYQKIAYFFGGVVATLGLVITVTDPKTLDNIVTFPERFKKYFVINEYKSSDTDLLKIIITAKLRRYFEETLDMSDSDKQKLAEHFASECISGLSGQDVEDKIKMTSKVTRTKENNDQISEGKFNKIVDNLISSIDDIPGLIEQCSYYVGVTLGVMGEMPIRDHVENAGQTRLTEGAIKLSTNKNLFSVMENLNSPR